MRPHKAYNRRVRSCNAVLLGSDAISDPSTRKCGTVDISLRPQAVPVTIASCKALLTDARNLYQSAKIFVSSDLECSTFLVLCTQHTPETRKHKYRDAELIREADLLHS